MACPGAQRAPIGLNRERKGTGMQTFKSKNVAVIKQNRACEESVVPREACRTRTRRISRSREYRTKSPAPVPNVSVCNGACAVRAVSEAWYHVDRSADGLVFEGTLGVELLLGTRQTKVAHLHVALACDLSSVVSLVVLCCALCGCCCVVSQNALERTARE